MSKKSKVVNAGLSKKRAVKAPRKKKSKRLSNVIAKPKVPQAVLSKLPHAAMKPVKKTNQDSARTSYCLTINGYDDSTLAELSTIVCGENITYFIYGKEVGESGNKHLQCYMQMKRRGIFFFFM